ncbi:hypothetical protein A9Q77_01315 [Marinomonas sp. 42_23_T18]|nr:hypothetical protein A9Q77_01315 [Marinomonas sp. 42_23_T18]
MSQWIIRLNAVFFGLYGLVFIFIPETMLYWVTGSSLNTPSAIIDVRATYGGMSLAVALLLYYFSIKDLYQKLGLIFVILIMGNMALGRSLGILIDGDANPIIWLYLIGELATLGLSVCLLKKQST